MSTFQDFISDFNNIKGITIGERKKELFELLKQHDSLRNNEAALKDFVKNLKPKTYLEEILLIKIVIHFKVRDELYSIFIGGNEILIWRIWKQKWFFREILQEKSAEFIVNELFQHLSYVNRMRFLKNVIYYTEDETKIDQLYDLVLLKYGFTNANQLLAGCSLKKIQENIQQNLKFSNKQIIFLQEKNYLNELMNVENCRIFDFYDSNAKSFSIIAGQNIDFFTEYFKQNKCLGVGKRLTKKLIEKEREYVIKNSADIYQNLHQRTLLKGLKNDFKKFFFDTWPKSFKNFTLYPCFLLLKYYPKAQHFEIIQEGLNVVYGKKIVDCPDLLVENLLRKIENVELRENLVEIKMKYSNDDYTLPQFYGLEKSIRILKEKISMADGVTTRGNLINSLVNTCKINGENSDALLEVLKYFCARHKNDDKNIRVSFLYEINKTFDLMKLKDEHWKYIMELIKMCQLKNDYYSMEIIVKYLIYLHENNANENTIKELALNSFENIMITRQNYNEILDDVPQLNKYLTILYANFVESTKKQKFGYQIFIQILDWNEKHPNDEINLQQYPEITKYFIETIEKGISTSRIEKILKRKIRCDEQFYDTFERSFWTNFPKNFSEKIVEYYLKENPLKIRENFEIFAETIFDKYDEFLNVWRLIKHYDHLELPKKTLEYLMKIDKKNAALACLMRPEEYLKMMPVPKSEKFNLDDENESEEYRKIENLLRFAKYSNHPSVLPRIVEFCRGDHLHSALGPLYFYYFHVAENRLHVHLETLSNRAVSVRKHAIKLACSVSPIETVYVLIENITNNEKNQSSLHHLFNKTFKYFLVIQSEKLWDLLKIQIKKLDFLDSFRDVCTIKNIPDKYKLEYLNFMWEILDKAEKNGKDVSNFQENLMRSLEPEIIEQLPYEFCSNLIKQKLLQNENKHIVDFTINCIKYGKSKDKIMGDFFKIIAEFQKNHIQTHDFNISRKNRSKINNLITSIYSNFSYDEKLDHSIIDSFYQNWKQIFDPIENIQNYIRLSLLFELKKMKNFNEYVVKISETFDVFVEKFGLTGVLDCFVNTLNFMLPDNIFQTENWNEKRYKLAFKLIDFSENNKLLAIGLLPQEIPENLELRSKLFDFIERLKKCDNNSVQVNLSLFILSLED